MTPPRFYKGVWQYGRISAATFYMWLQDILDVDDPSWCLFPTTVGDVDAPLTATGPAALRNSTEPLPVGEYVILNEGEWRT